MLFGLTAALTEQEYEASKKVLLGLKGKQVSKIGFAFSTGEKIFFDVDISDFQFNITERNRQVGPQTVTDPKVYSVLIKGSAEQ